MAACTAHAWEGAAGRLGTSVAAWIRSSHQFIISLSSAAGVFTLVRDRLRAFTVITFSLIGQYTFSPLTRGICLSDVQSLAADVALNLGDRYAAEWFNRNAFKIRLANNEI